MQLSHWFGNFVYLIFKIPCGNEQYYRVISVHTIHQMSSPPPLPFDATAAAAAIAADVRSEYVCEKSLQQKALVSFVGTTRENERRTAKQERDGD